jgi:hypothetical protein
MPDDRRPTEYRRPELPFERKADETSAALQWSAAGFQFAVSVVLFFLGGKALDANLGTGPWLSVIGSLVGIAVGTYLLLRPVLRAGSQVPSKGNDPREGRGAGEGRQRTDD